jgi:hypothetical protein
LRFIAILLAAVPAFMGCASAAQSERAIPVSDELAPYDAGFAYRASEKCPGVAMLIPLGPQALVHPDFKRGVAMFEHYVTVQTIDGACRAAAGLYDERTGKAAKLLGRK